jgi:hypothetical protein
MLMAQLQWEFSAQKMATPAGIGAVAEVDPYGTAIGDSCSAWALGAGFLRRTNDKKTGQPQKETDRLRSHSGPHYAAAFAFD